MGFIWELGKSRVVQHGLEVEYNGHWMQCLVENTKLYNEPLTYFDVNDNDPLLTRERIFLPSPPPYEEIEGYGLHPREQRWRVPLMPARLRSFIDNNRVNIKGDKEEAVSLKELNRRFKNREAQYKDEIAWIKKMWYKRLNGHWVFINGTPTFIDGAHFFYLAFWEIDIGLPDFRSRDWKFMHTVKHFSTTTYAFYRYKVEYSIEIKGKEIFQDYFSNDKKEAFNFRESHDGTIFLGQFWVDKKHRTCIGMNYPKHRREGCTNRMWMILFEYCSRHYRTFGAFQSMDGHTASKAYLRYMRPSMAKVPFFFMPLWAATSLEVRFVDNVSTADGGSAGQETGLGSFIYRGQSASRGEIDGDKVHRLVNDEIGKLLLEDSEQRINVQIPTLEQGYNMHGFMFNTSTVGDMVSGGGQRFFNICKNSLATTANSMGFTTKKLRNLFFPAYEGLDGFIDIFGNSVVEDPLEEDYWRLTDAHKSFTDNEGKVYGAKRYLLEKREALLLNNADPTSKENYEEECRLFPIYFSEAFMISAGDFGFNAENLATTKKRLMSTKSKVRIGNFEERNGHIIFVDSQFEGRFEMEIDCPIKNRNKRKKVMWMVNKETKEVDYVWSPMFRDDFTASCDPFKFSVTQGHRESSGSGIVWWNRDYLLDPEDKPENEWESYRPMITYKYRVHDVETYCRDMLYMCRYYGAMMYPENNITNVIDYFHAQGYHGYLKYRVLGNGKIAENPGFNTKGAVREALMIKNQTFIEHHSDKIESSKYIDEAIRIRELNELTDNDLLVSFGGAMLGADIRYFKYEETNVSNLTAEDYGF